ncbi:MAG: pinensin family lanthipeptide [Flavobacteriaceae bacterium]|nr:pinensin family lanthipeptide [Flavobacteriaceae bacterium]
MKNKKLNLNELKVKSFVTDFENEKENTVKGGGGTRDTGEGPSGPNWCITDYTLCGPICSYAGCTPGGGTGTGGGGGTGPGTGTGGEPSQLIRC